MNNIKRKKIANLLLKTYKKQFHRNILYYKSNTQTGADLIIINFALANKMFMLH